MMRGIYYDAVSVAAYESVHGRILAVNMAHQRKREASRNKAKDANTFSKIEKVNVEGNNSTKNR